MASTAIPAVKAAISKVLKAAASLKGVTVTSGTEPTRPTEYVWVWKAEANREFRLLGQTPAPLEEVVNVHLRVLAIRGDLAAAETRATTLFEAVETALRSVPKLEGTVEWHRIEKVEAEPLNFDTKVGFQYLVVVSAKARI